jgi:hypothetical protein
MIITSGNKQRKYIVHFDHVPHEGFTQCCIKDIRTKEIIGQGNSQAVKGDNFSRVKGRKNAFTRALADARIARPARRNMWKSYFTQAK